MKKQITQNELEHYFAKDMKSPIFCILAERYYNNYEYKKAEKVCHIGLENDAENIIGKYILAKVLLINKKVFNAEKILKEIIAVDPTNIKVLLTLIEVEKSLKRSQKTINMYISDIYHLVPRNKKIKKLYKQIGKHKNTEKLPKAQIKQKNKIPTFINKTMATKTMYKLMINQNKLDVAKSILYILDKEKKNKIFVQKELKIIKKLRKNK